MLATQTTNVVSVTTSAFTNMKYTQLVGKRLAGMIHTIYTDTFILQGA